MHLAFTIYLSIYAILIIANSIYCLYGKAPLKGWMLVYEILSGSLIIFMAAAYLNPHLKMWTNLGCVIAFIIVIILDMRFTIWGTPKDLGLDDIELAETEIDAAKGLSLLFASPAYILGLLLSTEIIFK